jgi:phosphoribosylanthranilate isomerase
MDATRREGRCQVKVCGVRTADEARLAIELGADLLGLNFYRPSPRFLEEEAAAALIAEVGQERTTWVGVFVDHTPDDAATLADRVGLDLLQFHGDQPADDVAPHAGRAIKAFRIEGRPQPGLADAWRDLGLWGYLVDARHPILFGGTGEGWDFASLTACRRPGERWLIAGGLKPGNVRAAVAAARPWGIDLCSGVEASPGVKDPAKMRELFHNLASLGADHG